MQGRVKKISVAERLKTVFRSLKYRNYRLFFSGQSISLIGTWMQRIAMPWLVYNITGSPFLLGLVSFAGQIPTFILSPLAGVLTDRWDKYRVLLGTQILSMILSLVLAILSLAEIIQIWQIVIISVSLGAVNAFDVPARHSFVIDMVEKKEDIGNAIALNSLMFNGARLIGPSVAGILVATTGEGICFLLNAISYVFVIISLLMMNVKGKEVQRNNNRMIMDMAEGLRYTFGFAPIKHIILLLALVSLMGTSYQVLMPVLATEILHGGSNTYGFLMGAAGFGALIGALFLASRESVIRLGRIIPAAAGLFGGGLVVLSFSGNIPFSLLLMVFIGIGIMLHTASSNTILQTITEDDKRGRVMSFYTMAIMGTAPFGSLLAGIMARLIGTSETVLWGGIACILGALIFLKKLPELRDSVRPVYVKKGIIPEVAAGIQTASEPDGKIVNVLDKNVH